MICDVQCLVRSCDSIISNTIRVLAPVDDDFGIVCFGKGGDLHVVPVGAPFRHAGQVSLKDGIFLGSSGFRGDLLGGEGTGVFSLWISSSTTSRVDLDEVFVVVTVGPHGLNDGGTDLLMPRLGSIELVRESMEETIP